MFAPELAARWWKSLCMTPSMRGHACRPRTFNVKLVKEAWKAWKDMAGSFKLVALGFPLPIHELGVTYIRSHFNAGIERVVD